MSYKMKFSVITITRNDKDGLEKTIRSVISQSFTDYEYIVIDGGSTDGSTDIIKKYVAHITYWISEPDKGIYNAMNKGVSRAHGEYLNFMNSGDCYHSSSVLEEINSKLCDEDILIGKCCRADTMEIYRGVKAGQSVTLMTLMKEMINHQSTFYKRTVFDRHLYDEQLRIIADWKLNLQSIVYDNCTVKVIDTLVTDYDMTGISTTNSELFVAERKKVMDELIPQRIQQDYERLYTDEELPIVTLLPQLKQSWRLQKFIFRLTKWLLKWR
jgi:glycosyltransferase involved in cell wall biosynthesis